MLLIYLKLLLLSLFYICCFTYRLNVPRVLLPFHPATQVKYNLIVSDPDDGCFVWRSTRPDVVTVQAHATDFNRKCTNKAQIIVTSKHAEEQTAIVFAENEANRMVLSCGVTVGVIRNISIASTTRVLFLDTSPVPLSVQAFNGEGDLFTSLGDIPFYWTIEKANAAEKPLQIIPFSQSKYEASEDIAALERIGKRGHVVLVEGISPGEAIIKTKLLDSFFMDVQEPSIDLLVVANLILIPSQDLYITPGSRIHYSAEIMKQTSTERVPLPSTQYRLSSSNQSVCRVDQETSFVTAIALGSAEITLVDESLKSTHAIKQPSTYLNVVEPTCIKFLISSDSWILVRGRNYTISIVVADSLDNTISLTDNLVLDTFIPENFFHIVSKTKNGTHFYLTSLKTGTLTITSRFLSATIEVVGFNIKGDREITIMDPVVINPLLVSIPIPNESSSSIESFALNLMAEGGSGSYLWSTSNSKIVSVNGDGVISAFGRGETTIIARDVRNIQNYGESIIHVSPAVKLIFSVSKREAEIGTTLELSPAILIERLGKELYVADCRRITLTYSVDDEKIYILNRDYVPTILPYGNGCTSIQLIAQNSGDTVVTFSFGNLSASVLVSAYPPLQVILPSEVLVMLGSTLPLKLSGGPRPWIIDPSAYYSQVFIEESSKLAKYNLQKNTHFITCGNVEGVTLIRIAVGNNSTVSNQIPAVSEITVPLCCSMIKHLSITALRLEDTNKICPFNANVFDLEKQVILSLTAFGHCKSNSSDNFEQQFSSITSLNVKWESSHPNLIEVNELPRSTEDADTVKAVVESIIEVARTEVTAKSESYNVDSAKINFQTDVKVTAALLFADFAYFEEPHVFIWNDENVRKKIKIIGGSGHFVLENFDKSIINATINRDFVEVRPLKLGTVELSVVDACLNNRTNLIITVSEIEEILLDSPKMAEVNEEFSATVNVRNSHGEFFDLDAVEQMKLELVSSSPVISIVSSVARNFQLRGVSAGTGSIVATLQKSGKVITSASHDILIYDPLILFPKSVTLLPGSVFQLEVQGGPQPLPFLHFNVDNSSVATVLENGLIHSLNIGTTSVNVALNSIQRKFSESVQINVVSLKGVKIKLSSSLIELNGLAWARVDGLFDDETPFAFGGALNPLDIKWTLSKHGTVQVISQLAPYVKDDSRNRFQINLKAVEAGTVILKVLVRKTTVSEEHFSSHTDFFEDQISITVIESLYLSEPDMRMQTLRVTPGSQINLRSNRMDGSTLFIIQPIFSDIISFMNESNERLIAHSVGDAIVEMKHMTLSYNESKFIHISVCMADSIHFELQSNLPLSAENEPLPLLPLGYDIHLAIVYRDRVGRRLINTKSDLRIRPNRFDLLNIRNGDDKTNLTVTFHQVGETVISVYDNEKPHINSFLYMLVGDVLKSINGTINEEDIICFRLPLLSTKWEEVDSKNFQFFKGVDGMAIARNTGNSTILSVDQQNRRILSMVSVTSSNLFFREHQSFISNIPGKQYLFPVVFGKNINSTNVKGCTTADLKKVGQLQASFTCSVNFNRTTPVIAAQIFVITGKFIPELGSYACVLEHQLFDGNPHMLINETSLGVNIKAIWKKMDKIQEVSTDVVFHPRFMVSQDEIRLDNVKLKTDTLLIISPISMMEYISVESCHPKILSLQHVRTSSTLLQYTLKLNVDSIAMWSELLKKCNLIVFNSYTQQLEEIPVRIVIHSGTSELFTRIKYGISGFLRDFLQKSVILTSLFIIIVSSIAIILGYRKDFDILHFLFGSTHEADSRTNDSFIGRNNLLLETSYRTDSSNRSRRSLLGKSQEEKEPFLWSSSNSFNNPFNTSYDN